MKAFPRILLYIFLLGLLIKCTKEEATSRDYPRIKTLPVTEITSGGAKFNAEIIFRGDFEVLRYGFVWNESGNPQKDSSERFLYTENIQTNKFSSIIETTLRENVSYFVRSFIETSNYTVYGTHQSFTSLGSTAPKINSINPLEGTVGDTVVIVGQNFSHLDKSNEVRFSDIRSEVFFSSDTLIALVVPEIASQKNIVTLSIAGNSTIFPDSFIVTKPLISSVDPQLASFGDTVEINGDRFSPSNEANVIYIGTAKAQVIQSSKKSVRFIVPGNLERSRNQLKMLLGGQETVFEHIQIKPPIIESISLATVTTFDVENIEIHGQNFNPQVERNNLELGNHRAEIISATNTRLIIQFPRTAIPKEELSVDDTLDVNLIVLDQGTVLDKALIINYRSTWTRKNDFPGAPRIFGAHFSIDEKGYIGLGGVEQFDNLLKDFWEYDPENDSWTRLKDFPESARSKFATFVIGKRAYIVGGIVGNQYAEENNLSEVWEFDSNTNTWTQKKDFPGGPRWSPFGFSIGQSGYIGGGVFGNYDRRTDFWKYDSSNDSWERLRDISLDLWHEDLFAISNDETGFIISNTCGTSCNEKSFWKYNPVLDEWIGLASMPFLAKESAGFYINNKLYSGTGVYSSSEGTTAFFSYDSNVDKWTDIADFLEPRRTASYFSIGNQGYMMLGRAACHCANKNDVWQFDPAKPD